MQSTICDGEDSARYVAGNSSSAGMLRCKVYVTRV